MNAWLLAAGLTLSGWAALSHAMPRHHQEAFGNASATMRLRLHRVAGWSALAASFAVCVAGMGIAAQHPDHRTDA